MKYNYLNGYNKCAQTKGAQAAIIRVYKLILE